MEKTAEVRKTPSKKDHPVKSETMLTVQNKLKGKKILVTGAGGMLGNEFKKLLEERGSTVLAFSKRELDVTDREAVLGCCSDKLDYIIHCAAKVHADFCEENPEVCEKIQIEGTRNIIDLARKTGAKIFYPQSFLIFNGETPIYEDTKPEPMCQYGIFKYKAEQLILENVPGSLVVRMGGFFGGYGLDKNFVGRFVSHLSLKAPDISHTIEVGDRIWQPTYVKDIAMNSVLLMNLGAEGVYNMASHGEATFYDVAERIVCDLGLSQRITIKKVSAELMTAREKAKRPLRATLVNARLNREGLDLQRTWEEALDEYLNNSYFKDQFCG